MNRKPREMSRSVAICVVAGVLGIAALSGSPAASAPAPAVQDATEDILYLNDGRVLRGKIIEEDRNTIRFEVISRDHSSITTKLTIMRSAIVRIERDIEVKVEDAGATTPNQPTQPEGEDEVDSSLPSIYVVPIRGQMGSDIIPELYDPIIEDIKAKRPDCVVFKLDSNSLDFTADWAGGQPYEHYEIEEIRTIAVNFRNKLRGIRQVVWVEDAVGISSLLAMSWGEMYMSPQSRLAGLVLIDLMTAGWQDAEVKAKMRAAWSRIALGIAAESSGRDLKLVEAMMFPEFELSAAFKGRDVIWAHDASGEVIVDSSDKWTPWFNAEDARNLRISQETIEPYGEDDGLNDLAFLLGFREYRIASEFGVQTVENYVETWRSIMSQTEKMFIEYQQNMGWASGDQAKAYLGRARANLEKILRAIMKYKAIEREWMIRGYTKQWFEDQIRLIEETLRGIGNQGRGRGGGGGPGGGPNPGGGG